MALVVGAALPLVAQYLSSALVGWARVALAGVVAGGFALLWWQRARLTGLRLGLALLAVAALAGWVWLWSSAAPKTGNRSACTRPPRRGSGSSPTPPRPPGGGPPADS